MAIYQKYRAKKFSEVISQTHVKDVLQASVINKTFGHAYLFVGTRGTGKTSLARIFARTINCQNLEYVEKNGEPCNECTSCLEAIAGNNVDIIELDAASNRGIDEVRNIIESVDFLPSGGKYKVYIIDEVHMMTKEAFNALLKTIEEPPAHAVFIMCTTEFFKVPPTIISRSQVFELKHASISEIIEKMNKVLESEKRQISQEGKEIIAKLGKGSFRDSESILEKVLTSSENKELNEEDVTSILGLSSIMVVEKVKTEIYNKNLISLQRILSSELDDGIISVFNSQLVESIYTDIKNDFQNNSIENSKLEIFEILTSISLKNISSPKLFYIAKILNSLKNNNSSTPNLNTSVSKNLEETPVQINETSKSEEIDINKFSTNPAALLRQRKKIIQDKSASQKIILEESEPIKTSKKKISKMDFLEFVKSKNLFLYRLFMNNEFEIINEKIQIHVNSKMQVDLLNKPQNKNLIQEFSKLNSCNLQLEIISNNSAAKKEEPKSQKVEDLNDSELDEIFNG